MFQLLCACHQSIMPACCIYVTVLPNVVHLLVNWVKHVSQSLTSCMRLMVTLGVFTHMWWLWRTTSKGEDHPRWVQRVEELHLLCMHGSPPLPRMYMWLVTNGSRAGAKSNSGVLYFILLIPPQSPLWWAPRITPGISIGTMSQPPACDMVESLEGSLSSGKVHGT